MDEKTDFLVVYDYGTGGLWGIMRARSKEEIARVYPELDVVDEPPAWMTPEMYAGYREQECHDIDGAPSGLLNAVLADRSRGSST